MSPLRLAAVLLSLAGLLAAPAPALAQDSTVVAADTVAPPDTLAVDPVAPDTLLPIAPPRDSSAPGRVGPMGAFLRSFLVPGWGQAALGRKTAAVLFVGVEGATVAMTVKTMRELADLGPESARLEAKKQQREDWLVLLAFNHLLSGLEAYVSAHLWDFPGDLSVRRVPGGTAAQVTLPLLIR